VAARIEEELAGLLYVDPTMEEAGDETETLLTSVLAVLDDEEVV
jgi:hypothetical protein